MLQNYGISSSSVPSSQTYDMIDWDVGLEKRRPVPSLLSHHITSASALFNTGFKLLPVKYRRQITSDGTLFLFIRSAFTLIFSSTPPGSHITGRTHARSRIDVPESDRPIE